MGMTRGKMDVDIETGRPVEEALQEKAREREHREKQILEEKAGFAEVLGSETGQALIGLVQGYLQRRIEVLIDQDPQAKAYLTILNDLGYKGNEAAQAVKVLMERYAGKQED